MTAALIASTIVATIPSAIQRRLVGGAVIGSEGIEVIVWLLQLDRRCAVAGSADRKHRASFYLFRSEAGKDRTPGCGFGCAGSSANLRLESLRVPHEGRFQSDPVPGRVVQA